MASSDSPEHDVSQAPADDASGVDLENDELAGDLGEEGEKKPLTLEIDIQSRSTCERHIVVKVSREDIERYFDREFSELVTSAQVPGFRPGHAPRKLIERRFRKEVADRVKLSLLLHSIEQISKERDLAAISEPKFDLDAVDLPDEGPMTYEFDLEVRPEFELPPWKGLTIERRVSEVTEDDVNIALRLMLSRFGQLVPHDGPAEMGDYISTKLTFTFDGKEISSAPEELICVDGGGAGRGDAHGSSRVDPRCAKSRPAGKEG